jgi:cysteine-rich repeat protein
MRNAVLLVMVAVAGCGANHAAGPDAGGDPTGPDASSGGPGGAPLCGDKVLESGEQCDDGNGTSGDGCSASCRVEPGWIWPGGGARPTA